MIGHKTNGNWTDVTSYGRNEIVFEGRNREYGAYVVRQRYNGTLLLALLIAASFGAIVAAVPMIIHYFNPAKPIPKTKDVDVIAHITRYLPKERKIELPHTVIPPRAPASSTSVAPPRIVAHLPIEVIPTNTVTATPTNNTPVTGTPTNSNTPITPIAPDPVITPVI